jgi:hypothetical protein
VALIINILPGTDRDWIGAISPPDLRACTIMSLGGAYLRSVKCIPDYAVLNSTTKYCLYLK